MKNRKKAHASAAKGRGPARSGPPGAAAAATVFCDVGELLTLAGAAEKGARRINEKDLSPVRDACLVERGGRVVWAGPQDRLPDEHRGRAAKRVSLGGATVIPAFVESHCHLTFEGARAEEFEMRCQGRSYQEIAEAGGGILSTVRATRSASRGRLLASAQRRADAFVRQGVATLEAKSGYALEASGELRCLEALGEVRGPRIVRTFLGAHAVPPEASSAESHLEEMARLLPEIRKRGLARRVDAFVERGYFDASIAEPYFRRALALGFDVAVHADQLTRSGGARLAASLGARSAEHLIRIDESDVRALAASETACVLLPAADLYMACDYPPARALIDAGARVALATDLNPGSSPTLDLSLVGVLARVQMKMTLPECLVAYTLGGAYALGLGNELGALVPGRSCDFAVLACDWREIFYSVGSAPVRATYREGRLIEPMGPLADGDSVSSGLV